MGNKREHSKLKEDAGERYVSLGHVMDFPLESHNFVLLFFSLIQRIPDLVNDMNPSPMINLSLKEEI